MRGGWIETLSAAELDELAAAAEPWLARVERDARALNDLQRADFPLPTLASRVARMTEELLHGRGFVLLRGRARRAMGQPIERRCVLRPGRAHRKSANAECAGTFARVTCATSDCAPTIPTCASTRRTSARRFTPTRPTSWGCCACRRRSRGGLSALVSSITLYNELRARRPDLARRLFAPFATDRRGEVPPGEKPYFTIPVFNWYAGALSAIYQRQYIDSAQRFADAPRLTAADIEALDLLDALTDDPALHLTMTLERGDMQFVHNHTLLHDRTAFEDHPEPARRRHLLRLWLAPPTARPLPSVFAQRYGSVVPGARGGVGVADDAAVMPLPEEWT